MVNTYKVEVMEVRRWFAKEIVMYSWHFYLSSQQRPRVACSPYDAAVHVKGPLFTASTKSLLMLTSLWYWDAWKLTISLLAQIFLNLIKGLVTTHSRIEESLIGHGRPIRVRRPNGESVGLTKEPLTQCHTRYRPTTLPWTYLGTVLWVEF